MQQLWTQKEKKKKLLVFGRPQVCRVLHWDPLASAANPQMRTGRGWILAPPGAVNQGTPCTQLPQVGAFIPTQLTVTKTNSHQELGRCSHHKITTTADTNWLSYWSCQQRVNDYKSKNYCPSRKALGWLKSDEYSVSRLSLNWEQVSLRLLFKELQ